MYALSHLLCVPAAPVIAFFPNDSWQIGTDNCVSWNVNSSESLSSGSSIGKTQKLPSGAEPAFLSASVKSVTRLLFSQRRFCFIKTVSAGNVFSMLPLPIMATQWLRMRPGWRCLMKADSWGLTDACTMLPAKWLRTIACIFPVIWSQQGSQALFSWIGTKALIPAWAKVRGVLQHSLPLGPCWFWFIFAPEKKKCVESWGPVLARWLYSCLQCNDGSLRLLLIRWVWGEVLCRRKVFLFCTSATWPWKTTTTKTCFLQKRNKTEIKHWPTSQKD